MVVEIKQEDVNIKRFNNGLTKEDVVKAVNQGLLKLSDDVADEAKKQAIVDLIKEGNTKEIQLKLGMVEDKSLDLIHRADDKFGKKTLENLRAGRVVGETPDNGGNWDNESSESSPSGANISRTKEEYLELLKPGNAEQLINSQNNKEGLLYPLRTLTITVSQDFRGTTKTDSLVFDFSENVIKDVTEAKTAFLAIKSILDAHPEPSNIQVDYSYDKTSKTRKKGVVDVVPWTTVESGNNALVKTSFIGYEDIEEYLDPEVIKILPTDIEDKLDKKNIKEMEVKGQKVYTFWDTYLIHKGGMRGISLAGRHDYFKKKDRLWLSSKLTFSDKDNSLEDCFKLMAFINLIGATFKDKQAGTNEKAHIDTDDFSSDFFSGNNPFYVAGGKLYFNDAVSWDDHDLLRKSNLEDMVSWVSLEDLAKFFTNRVDYKFDDAV